MEGKRRRGREGRRKVGRKEREGGRDRGEKERGREGGG